ncbi:MAG: hypothetical protein JWM80_4319 [Cyanobacteria bacterium RYN_339]|nr:hypothetical protein [Cyanobacteria bacterium RYN_339]
MIESLTPFSQLLRFTDAKRAASLTGRLLGLGLPERDAILAVELERFDQLLADARERASITGLAVEFDGSGLSLTDGGDTWTCHPDGKLDRRYDRFDGFETFLEQIVGRPKVDDSRPVNRDCVLEAAYDAFWSPSATNWQPTRVIEVVGDSRDALCKLVGRKAPPDGFPCLLLLRREHYDSLLSDVLEPFGLPVTAREESIDAGIFVQTLIMSALAQGLTAEEYAFTAEQTEAARPIVEAVLAGRLADLALEEDAMLARERAALAGILDFLQRHKYHADCFVVVGHPAAPVTAYPEFGRLVGHHSTQRVASPAAEFGHAAMMRLWEVAERTLPPDERGRILFADFSWHEQVPPRIGKAMFEALYGVGADAESKAGGDGGILTAVTVRNYLLIVGGKDPGWLAGRLPTGWGDLDDSALRKAAKDVPVRGDHLGRYIRERILRDGKYVIKDGLVVDLENRPLTVPLLVRMMKSLAATFGNFFLKFQNTHPQNAVLLADTAAPDGHKTYRAVGKAAAVLTFLSRALGASSIIKSGPIDLARDPIARILAENPDDLPHLRPWKDGLERGVLLPALTFQVGMPLAGSDVVEPGTPGEHTGLEERKRDKRPPREDFTWHYLPVLERLSN